MSVQDITEMWSRHGATITSAKATPSDSVIAYTAAYQVAVSDPANDDAAVVRASELTPKIGDYYGGDTRYRAKSITISRLSPIFYQIEVGYEGLEDPELSRPSLSWSSVGGEEEIDRDIYNRPLMMATGEPVSGITRQIVDQQLTITRRFELFDPSFWSEYINWSVNADTFAGFPPGTGRRHLSRFRHPHPLPSECRAPNTWPKNSLRLDQPETHRCFPPCSRPWPPRFGAGSISIWMIWSRPSARCRPALRWPPIRR